MVRTLCRLPEVSYTVTSEVRGGSRSASEEVSGKGRLRVLVRGLRGFLVTIAACAEVSLVMTLGFFGWGDPVSGACYFCLSGYC